MRLFVAINFSNNIRAAVTKIRDGLKNAAICGRFSYDENLHLTLVFLGECDGKQAGVIKAALDKTAFTPFTLALDRVGCFRRDEPTSRRLASFAPSKAQRGEGGDIWWLGLKENAALSALQAELSERLRQSGFVLENRKYTPHVTLGREVRMPASFIAPKVEPTEFNVASVELMKSEHINGRLTYTPIYSKSAK